MSRTGRCVLVTGGAGYIGSHTAKALSQAGFYPVVLDDLRAGHAWAVRYGPLVKTDLADPASLNAVFRDYPIEAVIHFAASAYVGESMRTPQLYFRNNLGNTLNLLETMLEHGVTRLVFSSSCATYGHPNQVPITEDHEQRPISPYGESKLMVERVLFWYGQAYGFRSAALRYFNAAGADPEGDLGEVHDPETHLIPLAILAAAGAVPALDVYGTDYDTMDGTAVRDYIHVTDLAEAHVAAMRYLESSSGQEAFNLGTGIGHSVRQVMSMVEQVSGRAVPFRECSRRPGDPGRLVADARKAGRCLDWRPRYSDLHRIVETAWNWHAAFSRTAADIGASGNARLPTDDVRVGPPASLGKITP